MKLGVNVDHVATLRQARGTSYPDPLDAAIICARAGADNITAHLREDRRHIQDEDIYRIKNLQSLPLNLEMANSKSILQIALDVLPSEVCIVPEKREELTTEGGLNVIKDFNSLQETTLLLVSKKIHVSLFIEPNSDSIVASKDIGANAIELHTGTYCDADEKDKPYELEKLIEAAELANNLGLTVNAGHGINIDNINGILCIPHIKTLNIGHSIISRSIFIGIEKAVKEIYDALNNEND
jgi:pyridoxine 5-phosphate synthase